MTEWDAEDDPENFFVIKLLEMQFNALCPKLCRDEDAINNINAGIMKIEPIPPLDIFYNFL